MSLSPIDNELPYSNQSIFLSQEDVDRLLNDSSADSRISVLSKVSKQYCVGNFHAKEMALADQIFRILMRDTEIRVRKTLAEELKSSHSVPRDIILSLAKDHENIALPVLKASEILSDADLIDIIETSREVNKLIAISQRNRVSSRVSDALIETSYPQVVTSLLHNQGATLSANHYEDILAEFASDKDIIDALVTRSNLPLTVVEKLIGHVSEQVSKQLEDKYKLSDYQAKSSARESVTLSLTAFDRPDSEIDVLITQMIANDRLTPSIILSSLCGGKLSFFEIALARLANIPKPNARKLIHDKGPLGFKALYEKSGLPASMYDAVKLVVMTVEELQSLGIKPNEHRYSSALVDGVLKKSQGAQIENLPYIIALIRQGV